MTEKLYLLIKISMSNYQNSEMLEHKSIALHHLLFYKRSKLILQVVKLSKPIWPMI